MDSTAQAPSDTSMSSASSSTRRDCKSVSLSVTIQPTIGPSFSLSVTPGMKVSSLKEVISDKMGLSPQKMTLLFYSRELLAGSLMSNGIENGSEIRLVPAIESGVTTVNSVDPVAMMKHSMSGISDQQIEDFLNGKSPLSVAIRVGESVVVVNLHRAKVEEIEMEPPPTKRRCVAPRQIAVNEIDYPDTDIGSSQCSSLRHLNTNRSPNELMDTSEHAPSTSIQRRSSRLLERSIRSTRGVSPVSVCEPAPVLLSEPLPEVQDVDRQSSFAAVVSDPALASTIDSPSTSGVSKKRTIDCKHSYRSKYSHKGKSKASTHYHSHRENSKMEYMSPLVSNSVKSRQERSPTRESKSHRGRSVSRAVQTEPELSRSREHSESKHHKSGRQNDMKLLENGISMKRKAVMDAISEILKKMYANSEKGRLPGSFKGRFSSEFTCDSNMHEILHSKTTMTSYGGELDSKHHRGAGSSEPPTHEGPLMSKAKFEENQMLKDKVAHIKWRMQQNRAIRKAKRQGERSACGWMEALNCSMPVTPPKERETFGGLKPGFLLSGSSKV